MGRGSWLDQFLTLFGFLSILFWVRYLNTNKNSYIIYASLFSGLAMLTKYAGWYFPVIIIFLSVFHTYQNQVKLQNLLRPLLIFLVISISVFLLLYPAIWVDPYKVLFARWNESHSEIKSVNVIGGYINHFRLIDPVLIFGFVFVLLDWIKRKKSSLFYIGMAGLSYISIYLLTFVGLFLTHKLDNAFLVGLYRYTYPALPLLALYFFNHYERYIENKTIRNLFILILFLREILFSPFLFF